jgi:hypothetical protein
VTDVIDTNNQKQTEYKSIKQEKQYRNEQPMRKSAIERPVTHLTQSNTEENQPRSEFDYWILPGNVTFAATAFAKQTDKTQNWKQVEPFERQTATETH